MLLQVHVLGAVHHVGVACKDLEPVRRWVHETHLVESDTGIVHDDRQRADLCLLTIKGGPAIELVAGPAVDGVLHLKQSYYHVCYEVGSISTAIEELEAMMCKCISGPVPAVLFGGRSVAFLLGPTGLIELLEV